ncbi:unnamed protein product [Caenorhabditis bovis]|uniref:NUCB1-like N-terminal domain-containing protein n=1 Tax=Caenorhabditis bovis TaxID=2654633 RepID=A0A8S1EIV7_9PELO|nr:unnamed protein product [Caenorhabditis bovis]
MFKLGILLACLVSSAVCPPPMRQQAEAAQAQDSNSIQDTQTSTPGNDNSQQAPPQTDEDRKPIYEFTYSKYLEEVVQILESDPKFYERLRGMNETDIKKGNIADHIDDLDSAVFDKLHKAKFAEIERLREQIAKQIEADGGAHNVKMPEHLDVQNFEKFHKEDLRKLIQKTVADMEAIDQERKEKFKQYKLQKKAEEDHRLAQMTPEEREKVRRKAEEAMKRHNQHENLKHPGSRDQLEEVWEESDHLEKDQFNPRTFFALHDLNGDGYWNDAELEALFQIELEKMYNETNPDDDPKERLEEMYRMREHVSKQMDTNGDRLISLQEFLADTEAQTPNKDEGWKDLGQEQIYTDEELQAFEKEYAAKNGWGENAYLGKEVVIPRSDEQHPAQNQQQQYQHQQPPQQQQQVPPAHQPVHPAQQVQQQPPVQQQAPPQQQQQQQPPQQPPQQQPVQNAVPQNNLPPVHHAPIEDHKKDSTYGI